MQTKHIQTRLLLTCIMTMALLWNSVGVLDAPELTGLLLELAMIAMLALLLMGRIAL